MGQPLPGSAEGLLRGGFLVARLCPRPAPFPALVGGCEPQPGDQRGSRYGSHFARLYSLPDQSAAVRATHFTGRVSSVRPRRGATDPAHSSSIMRQRRPLDHPLKPFFARSAESLTTALGDASVKG